MIIDPTKEQFAKIKAMGDAGPIHMLNLIKLRARANYEDGEDISGEAAYDRYGALSSPIFKRVGGQIVHSWDPKVVVIGPHDGAEDWDMAFIAEYQRASAFVEMVRDEEYRAIVHHRQAAVENSRLVCLMPKAPLEMFG